MNTQVNLLSDNELDVVAGGMMNIQKGSDHTAQGGGGGGSFIPGLTSGQSDIALGTLLLMGLGIVLSL